MKKIYQLSMLLLAGAFALTACTDDNESNPTLTQPTQFVPMEISIWRGLLPWRSLGHNLQPIMISMPPWYLPTR